jgi:hypothetical protein
MGHYIDNAGSAAVAGVRRGCIVMIYALAAIGVVALIAYFVLR